MERFLGLYSQYAYALMRIVVGLLFACNGSRKIFGVFGGRGGTDTAAPLFSLTGLAGSIEFLGGLMIAVGFLTGYAAFVASGEMAVAYFMGHFHRGFWPMLNQGERAVFYSFLFLYIASMGYGGLTRFSREAMVFPNPDSTE